MPGNLLIYDRLFVCGAYAFNANTALASQPSFSGRVPGGTAFTGLEIWVETVTAGTGNQTWNVTYTNQAGTGSRTTGAVGVSAAPILGRCWQLPLQAGDSGVQQINNVQGGTGSAGTANIMVLRPLAQITIGAANRMEILDFFQTGGPEVFADSALYMICNPDSTATGTPRAYMDVKNG